MKRSHISYYSLDQAWLMPLITLTLLSLLLLLAVTAGHSKSPAPTDFSSHQSKLTVPDRDFRDKSALPKLPRLAYLISGTKGEGSQVRRLLQAVYHPRNYYLLHLDLDASDAERLELAKYATSESVIKEFGNVMVIGKADLLTYKGPTMIASTLHAIAILLKQANDWDWFVNLSASDYPLMPQDGNSKPLAFVLFAFLFCVYWFKESLNCFLFVVFDFMMYVNFRKLCLCIMLKTEISI